PVADGAEVDGNHGGHERPLVTEGNSLADEGTELELVLDELRRKGRAVAERADILGAIDDDEMALRVDEPGVTRVKPPVRLEDLACRLLVLEIPLEPAVPPHEHLAAIGDLDLDALHGTSGGGRIRLGVRLERHEAGRLRGAVDLLQIDADGSEEPERVRAERRTAGQRP